MSSIGFEDKIVAFILNLIQIHSILINNQEFFNRIPNCIHNCYFQFLTFTLLRRTTKHSILTITFALFCTYISVHAQNRKQQNLAPNTPNTCRIEGKIMRVIKTHTKDTSSPCYKYPCLAKVKIIRLFGCGSSVSLPLNEGDTLEISFAYTLHNTKNLFPGMKTHYPGLKKGDIFIANTEQRLQMGSGGTFVVYDYQLQ